MSDIQDSIQNQFFDNSDNWKECTDWGASGIQAQILADFYNSKPRIYSPAPVLPKEAQAAALRGINFFSKF